MQPVRFIFGIHNHQPLGNFDFVIERIVREAYRPFLETVRGIPSFRMALHMSGALLQWCERKDPRLLDLIGELVAVGQIELFMGGFFEPILASLPREDRKGQILMMREYLRKKFGVDPQGLWLAERVWEPDIVEDLVETGVRYIVVDDRHFLVSGIPQEGLYSYYVTEDKGKRLFIFPIDQRLRYAIPFKPPEELAVYFRQIYDRGGGLATYMDDGEKFGGWPGTREWVYEKGWLQRFFKEVNRLAEEYVEMITFAEAIEKVPPAGLCYLSTASYAEMEEWALPARNIIEVQELKGRLGDEGARFSPFIRGGHWKYFFVKYPESNRMHKKMLMLSVELRKSRRIVPKTVEELYAAQCNDAYWHGIFGGLYLPHLRHEIWKRLARVEGALRGESPLSLTACDYDYDGREEVIVTSRDFSLIWKPSYGGQIVEYILFSREINYLNTLIRYREAYHGQQEATKGIKREETSDRPEGIKSIHEYEKQADTTAGETLSFDWYHRGGFIDHFFPDDLTLQGYRRSQFQEQGDFVTGPFSFQIIEKKIRMERIGTVRFANGEQAAVMVQKEFTPLPDGSLRVFYEVENRSEKEIPLHFGVEVNLFLRGIITGRGGITLSGERYPLDVDGRWENVSSLILHDDPEVESLTLSWQVPATLWIFPVRTVSQSERGFDKTWQCLSLTPSWKILLLPHSSWRSEITWKV